MDKAQFADMYEAALNNICWTVHYIEDGQLELESYSPAGENIVLESSIETIYDDTANAYQYFDIDDHVMLWIGLRGENGVPDTIEQLLEDAKEIERMYQKLWVTVDYVLKKGR